MVEGGVTMAVPTAKSFGFNPYVVARRQPPRARSIEEILSFPFLQVPALGANFATVHCQTPFKAKRFCVYADDASKLRVCLHFGADIGGAHPGVPEMPAALFADGPTTDLGAFVLNCSNCGAPTAEGASKCRYCAAPFTWRIVETAYGQSGLALDFPPLPAGMQIRVTFTNRSEKAIGVDCALVGLGLALERGII